jgi:hypothetical protein
VNFADLNDAVSFLSDTLTIITSSIAIYLFACKRRELAYAFKVLVNFSYQTTLMELNSKLDRLNDFRVDEPDHKKEIRNMLHEIAGQVRGNRRLSLAEPRLADYLEEVADSKKLNEAMKRSAVSKVREQLKNVNVASIKEILGERDE